MSRKVLGILNFLFSALLLATLILVYLYPESIPFFRLSERSAQMLIMNFASALLLLGFFHKSLSTPWKALFAVLSIMVMVESVLMSGIWQ